MKRKASRRRGPGRSRKPSYDQEIPSRKSIVDALDRADGPLSVRELAGQFRLKTAPELEALATRLRAMERDGQIVRNRRGSYGPVSKLDLVVGRVIGHADGFGFLRPEQGGDDIFLSARQMRSLLHGDRAVVRQVGVDRRGRPEGALVDVLQRANDEIVGKLFVEGGIGFVVPDNKRLHQDVLIPDHRQARAGQIVLVDVVDQPDQHRQPLGRIKEVLGDALAAGMETDIAIRSHGLPVEWSEDVLEELSRLPDKVRPGDVRGRRDLRDKAFVTIDGADARDFDDAVYCEQDGGAWRLFVAIADVSHYVTPGSALDAEARSRGTSVYFPDRVVPMLPEPLSNGLCSLNPQVDRLVLVCEVTLGSRGKRQGFRLYKGVIRSAARLTYDQVWSWLSGSAMPPAARERKLLPDLRRLHELYQQLHRRRQQRGALELDTVESRVEFDEHGQVRGIAPLERNEAHMLIEECMLEANVATAEFLLQHKVPGPFRIHETPDPDKVDDLRTLLGELGLRLEGGKEPRPKDFTGLLNRTREREDAHLIQTVVLRSLKLAVYSDANQGHFGLAYPAYTHFTSPIRRYPDLMVHRAVTALTTRARKKRPYSQEESRTLCEHCSMTERRADEATRDVVARLKCIFMQDKVGETFAGIISGVTSFGLFVELQDFHVEGLIHITELPNDYYHFDAVGHHLTGERTGRKFRLGNPVKVRVVRVDVEDRKIDFRLEGAGGPRRGDRGRG